MLHRRARPAADPVAEPAARRPLPLRRQAEHQLALSEPAKHNAIHGLVRWVNWTAADRAADRVSMRHALYPQAGWPFALELALAYELAPGGLRVTTTATNAGDGPCPYGAGWHPYLAVGTERIDAGAAARAGRPHQSRRRAGHPVPATRSPSTARPSTSARPARSATRARHAATAISSATRTASRGWSCPGPTAAPSCCGWTRRYRHLCCSPATRSPRPAGGAAGWAVEPMTCAPNALAERDGLAVLAPGESATAVWGLTATR